MKGFIPRIIKAVACTICAAMGDAPKLEKPKIKELYLPSIEFNNYSFGGGLLIR